ncbi:hypothetical protein APHAL10511_005440 [Amanita phalloides]|nr:hypothetical protein APHAL10511_005440 [Amanita phalloides]
MWTSDPGDPYILITGHYINTLMADRPNEWELRTEQLAFMHVKGWHTGKNITELLVEAIDKYEICGKVGWFTSDGATVNRMTLWELEKSFEASEDKFKAKQQDIMCMEHALHTVCKHFVKAIVPASLHAIHKKIKEALRNVSLSGELDLDQLDDELLDLGLDGCDAEADDNDDNIEFSPGDALGKALALVKQIQTSSQARMFFQSSCVQVGIQPLELQLWI